MQIPYGVIKRWLHEDGKAADVNISALKKEKKREKKKEGVSTAPGPTFFSSILLIFILNFFSISAKRPLLVQLLRGPGSMDLLVPVLRSMPSGVFLVSS